jgi:hypothetical protein
MELGMADIQVSGQWFGWVDFYHGRKLWRSRMHIPGATYDWKHQPQPNPFGTRWWIAKRPQGTLGDLLDLRKMWNEDYCFHKIEEQDEADASI